MPSGLAARNGGWLGLSLVVAVLVLGLGLRLGYAWDGRAPVYDAQAYAAIAANLERGEGFTVGEEATQPSSNYSPGLPLLVAGIYVLSGGVHEQAARVVLALIASLAVLFTYLLGRRLAAPGPTSMGKGRPGVPDPSSVAAGLLGALAVAVYPAFLEYGGMLMSEPLAATLLSGGVLALCWAWDPVREAQQAPAGEAREAPAGEAREAPAGEAREAPAGEAREAPAGEARQGEEHAGAAIAWPRWLLAGLALGALALVRPEYLGVGVLLALVVLLSGARPLPLVAQRATKGKGPVQGGGLWRWRWLGAPALVLAGMAVVVVPWTVRNAVALDRAVPISTGGGQVLYAGTYLPSDGDPERVGAGVVAENPQLFGPDALQRLRLEQILARLGASTYPQLEPDRALSRLGREQLWDDVSRQPLEFAGFVATKVGRIWSHGPRAVMRQPVWEALHWAILTLGLLGLGVLLWRRRWEALIFATVFLAITALSALLVASPRRVLVMLPLLAACAGFGAVWAWAQMRKVGPRLVQKRSS